MSQGWGPQPPGYPPQGGYGPYGHGPPPPGYGPPGHGYSPPPPKKGNTVAWIVVGVVGFLFVVGVASGNKTGGGSSSRETTTKEPTRRNDATPTPPAAPVPPPKPAIDLNVTAVKLWQDYQANEVAADNIYKTKTLLVSGKVSSVDKDFMDNIVVRLATPNQFMNVMATVKDSEKSKAAQLSKGQDASVLCEGGGMIIGSPVLKDCTIQ